MDHIACERTLFKKKKKRLDLRIIDLRKKSIVCKYET